MTKMKMNAETKAVLAERAERRALNKEARAWAERDPAAAAAAICTPEGLCELSRRCAALRADPEEEVRKWALRPMFKMRKVRMPDGTTHNLCRRKYRALPSVIRSVGFVIRALREEDMKFALTEMDTLVIGSLELRADKPLPIKAEPEHVVVAGRPGGALTVFAGGLPGWMADVVADRYGLSALAAAYATVPQAGKALNTRPYPILPSRLAMAAPMAGEKPNSPRLSLFSAARHKAIKDGWLPGFEVKETAGPCLPLVLYDLMNPKHKPGSPAADLALRMFIEAVLALDELDRAAAVDRPVLLPGVTLRGFLKWFYDPAGRTPRPNEFHPRLEAAAEALASNRARIEWVDPVTGKGGRRTVVRVEDLPRGPGKLDDEVKVSVFLPPGTKDGPTIDRKRLRYWGRKSESAYRALLGLAFRWHRPGVTRIPIRKNGGFWYQSQNPEHYQAMSPDELIELCYPTSKMEKREKLLTRAFDTIGKLERAGDLTRPDSNRPALILPPKRHSTR